jgi:hypothetical protein
VLVVRVGKIFSLAFCEINPLVLGKPLPPKQQCGSRVSRDRAAAWRRCFEMSPVALRPITRSGFRPGAMAPRASTVSVSRLSRGSHHPSGFPSRGDGAADDRS